MKGLLFFLFLVLIGAGIQAQSPGMVLMDQAKALLDAGNEEKAFEIVRQCRRQYPLAVRTYCDRDDFWWMLNDRNDPERYGASLVNSIVQQYLMGTLRSDDTCFTKLFSQYPFTYKYNSGRCLYGEALIKEGKEDEGEHVWLEILTEELAAPCPSEAGFIVATHLAMRRLEQQRYEEAINYQRLTHHRLRQHLVCGNDKGSGHWIFANIGLAYAGLHQEDSALFYLQRIVFMESPYSSEDSTLAIDSLIALLSREDATPFMDRLEQAIAEIEFQDSVLHCGSHNESNEIRCVLRIGEHRFPLVWDYYRNGEANRTMRMFHKEWPFPFTKETCQAMVKASPFYRRVMGGVAAEVFEK